ncbi:MAG: cytochrome c oxidase subunit II transmembrane domain-containing protein, partial [Pseudomonadota bacterium]
MNQDLPSQTAMGLREAATPVAEEIHLFYDFILLPMKIGISLFVLGLLVWVVMRYNKRANPKPSRFSHNTLVEILWTGIPVLILLIIAVPSFELLQVEDTMPDGQVFEYEKQSGTLYGFKNAFPEARMVKDKRHIEVLALSDAGDRRILYPGDDFEVNGLGGEEVRVTL